MTKLLRLGLLTGLLFSGVGSLLASGVAPDYATGGFAVETLYPQDYGSKIGLCAGERFTLSWEIYNGRNPKLTASPSQNLEPPLESLSLSSKGETQFIFKDSATLTLTIDAGEPYRYERSLVVIPASICTGFPLELRGNYTGTLEQVTPQVVSVPHLLTVRWAADDGLLAASLVRGTVLPDPKAPPPNPTFAMTCTALEQEDELTCVYEPPGAAVLMLEGRVTSAGYAGTYQGVLEGTTFQTPTSGTFNFVKQE
jgi:hypothetical protein